MTISEVVKPRDETHLPAFANRHRSSDQYMIDRNLRDLSRISYNETGLGSPGRDSGGIPVGSICSAILIRQKRNDPMKATTAFSREQSGIQTAKDQYASEMESPKSEH